MELEDTKKTCKLLCNGCLCLNNKLYEIFDQKLLIYYVTALREIPLLTMRSNSLHLCFDCRAQMYKAISFKEQVKDSYRILQAYTNENLNEYLISDVSRPPRLKVSTNEAVSISPNIEIIEGNQVMVKEEVKIDWDDETDFLDPVDDSLQTETKEVYVEVESIIKKKIKDRKKKKKKKISKQKNNKIITIDITYEEMMLERERDRDKDSYKKAEFKCDKCVLAFKYQTSYKMHLETKHNESIGEYICSICNTVLPSVHSMATHHKRHTRRYECSVCHKRTVDLKVMKQHYQTKHELMMKEYTCNHCGKVSNSLDSHRYHKDTHKARLQCAECDKTFRHRAALMNHRIAVHECHNEFPCTLCDKVFRWKNSLRRHLAEKHEEKNKSDISSPYCELCDIYFSSIFSYNRHMNNSLKHVSSSQLRFICDHCNRRFADKTKLRDHIEEKHLNKTYQCHLCLKPSKNRVGLDQHIRNVHKGRPINKICHHCGKGFPTKLQLESHIRTHTGEKPFICEFCPTTFSQQSNLNKHNRQVHRLNKKRKDEKHPVIDQNLLLTNAPVTFLYTNENNCIMGI